VQSLVVLAKMIDNFEPVNVQFKEICSDGSLNNADEDSISDKWQV
jgi:hypothetical protein